MATVHQWGHGGSREAGRTLPVQESDRLVVLVEAAVRGAVSGGASRQVAAAVTAAAMKVALGADGSYDNRGSGSELGARLSAIRPVLAERIGAAVDGRQPRIPGNTRLRRNVAEHVGFGNGSDALAGSAADLKRRQRGRRRHSDDGFGGSAFFSARRSDDNMVDVDSVANKNDADTASTVSSPMDADPINGKLVSHNALSSAVTSDGHAVGADIVASVSVVPEPQPVEHQIPRVEDEKIQRASPKRVFQVQAVQKAEPLPRVEVEEALAKRVQKHNLKYKLQALNCVNAPLVVSRNVPQVQAAQAVIRWHCVELPSGRLRWCRSRSFRASHAQTVGF
jgi:hypothetical protein